MNRQDAIAEAYAQVEGVIIGAASHFRGMYESFGEAKSEAIQLFLKAYDSRQGKDDFGFHCHKTIVLGMLEFSKKKRSRASRSVMAIGRKINFATAPEEFDRESFLEKLSEDGQVMALLVLDPPLDFIEMFPPHERQTLMALRRYLRLKYGWHRDRIWDVVREIRRALKGNRHAKKS